MCRDMQRTTYFSLSLETVNRSVHVQMKMERIQMSCDIAQAQNTSQAFSLSPILARSSLL